MLWKIVNMKRDLRLFSVVFRQGDHDREVKYSFLGCGDMQFAIIIFDAFADAFEAEAVDLFIFFCRQRQTVYEFSFARIGVDDMNEEIICDFFGYDFDQFAALTVDGRFNRVVQSVSDDAYEIDVPHEAEFPQVKDDRNIDAVFARVDDLAGDQGVDHFVSRMDAYVESVQIQKEVFDLVVCFAA